MEWGQSTTITSTRNPRIIQARKLEQRKHRERQRRFLVEGLQHLQMALAAGMDPVEVYFCQEQFEGRASTALMGRYCQTTADLFAVSSHVMQALSGRQTPSGIVACYAMCEASLADLHPTGGELVIVLDRLQYPGNVGTLIRAADAVGAAAVILIEPGADAFDDKAIRSSRGSLFNVPLVRTDDVPALFDWLSCRGFQTVGADPHQGESWGRGLWEGSTALVLGNEGRGLSAEVRARLTGWARLPIVGKVDSLNVAVAGGVLMYEWLQANYTDNDTERNTTHDYQPA